MENAAVWRLCSASPTGVAVCCSVLQCAAVCCGVLQCVAVCCSVLQCVAVCCSVLRCAAVCYSMLQCVALGCVLHSVNTVQHTATHCDTLQHSFISMLSPLCLHDRSFYVCTCVTPFHTCDRTDSYV